METPEWICEFLNIKKPPRPKIGTKLELCPECGSVLSHRDNVPFCRCEGCQRRIKEAHRVSKPIWERH